MADVDAPRRPGTPPRANIATGHPPHAPAPPGVLARTGRPHPPSSALEVCTSMPEKAVVEKAKEDLRGRVRSRGDRARPGGQARCPLRQAGHRHRVVQGAPRGGPAQATEEGADVEQDAALGQAGVRGWTEEAEAEVPVAPARSGRLAGAEARATPLGLTVRALAAGQERGTAPASVSAPCHASLEDRSRCGSAGRPR